jgi:hypothetical protein
MFTAVASKAIAGSASPFSAHAIAFTAIQGQAVQRFGLQTGCSCFYST